MTDAVVAGRYARAVEAEVARTQLEAAGIDCVVHSSEASTELRVRAEELDSARAVLELQPAVSARAKPACPGCGGRRVETQGKKFWTGLGAVLALMVIAAFLVSFPVLIILALAGTVGLTLLEISLGDWRCIRCGRRWRS